MKTQRIIQITLTFILSIFATGCASSISTMSENDRNQAYADYIISEKLESLDRITTFRFDGFNALSDENVIISTSFHKAYLITLQYRCHNLRYANAIKVNKTGASLMAKFDSISAHSSSAQGERCHIKTIHRITQEQKKAIQQIGRKDILEDEAKTEQEQA